MSKTFVFLVALIFLSVAGFLALPRERQFDIRDAIKRPFAPQLDLPPDSPASTEQDTWVGEYQRRGYNLKCYGDLLPEERIDKSNDYLCWGLISKAYDNIPARTVSFFFSKKELRHVKVEFPASSFTALQDYLSRRLAKYPRLDLDTRHQFGTDIYGKPLIVWGTANGLVTTSSAATAGQSITVLWSAALVAPLAPAAPLAAVGHSRTPAEYEKVDTFVNEPLGFPVVETLANLRKVGLVTREKVGVVANRHDPKQNDEIRTLQFDGLVIDAYFPSRDHNRGIITGIVVSKPQWKLRHGLNVGVAATEVEAALGNPDEREPERMTYCGDAVCGTFFLRDNLVIKVAFEGSVD